MTVNSSKLQKKKAEEEHYSQEEVISAEVRLYSDNSQVLSDLDEVNRNLQAVNSELERFTNSADRTDYAIAVGSGILAGLLDSVFVGAFNLEEADQWGNERVNDFVLTVAKIQGYRGDELTGAIEHLEDLFPIAADKVTNEFGSGLQHHLRDFSHHPTPVGLICSILTQFTGKVYGTNKAGVFQSVQLSGDGLLLIGRTFPEKIMFGVVNWAFHLASDMAGSSGSVRNNSLGTGIPGPLVSILKELSSTPLFRKLSKDGNKEFSVFISQLFRGENNKLIPYKFDLRTELGVARYAGRQAIPVLLNECIVRSFYFLRRLTMELGSTKLDSIQDLATLNWNRILPFQNRTVDRMLTISSMTFNVADTADAAIHAAIETGGNWVLFSGKFVARFNYVGAGRAALAIVKEISDEKKETQLLHEKMLLSDQKASLFLGQLQEFKARLEERVSNYLAEDITEFMSGFDYMRQGLVSGNSDLVIHGNVIIQKVLGREPQFTNQEEFDALMESDIPLTL